MTSACAAQLALVVLLVAGIHFIEAYALNPAIYSAHLKLHPLLVLSVLVIAEHSLGVWGLLLAGEASCLLVTQHCERELLLHTRGLNIDLDATTVRPSPQGMPHAA